jgi:hypothetical protein
VRNRSVIVSFGELKIAAPDVVRLTCRNAIDEIPTATVRLDARSRTLHALPLNERVVIEANGHGIFAGQVVAVQLEEEDLVVNCSTAPEMGDPMSAAVAKAYPGQLIRLIALDAGSTLPLADDSNELCPAATRCLDWDALLSGLERAPDFLSFAPVLQQCLRGTKLSKSERTLLSQVLGLVRRETAHSGLAQAPVGNVQRRHYEAAFPEIWACSWRHRKIPDQHEVVVPLRQVVAPSAAITVAGVEFVGTDARADEYIREDAPKGLQSDWSAIAYARTIVEASDLWTAKAAGLSRIGEAMALVGFVYSYSAWHQKVDEGVYLPIQYARPAGAPGVLGSLVRVVNLKSGEHWLGPTRNQTNPCDLAQLESLRGSLLSQAANSDETNELVRHVRRAISWRYRALLATMPVDAFLFTWVSLEMLFQRPHEKTSHLVRRLPFVVLSVGDKPGEIRTELQRQWIPLRDAVVHQALQTHPRIDAACRRVHYFSDCAIGYALMRAQQSPSYDDWLDHLDDLSRRKPA